MAEYPEHEKVKENQEVCERISDFLEWLGEHQYSIIGPDGESTDGELMISEYIMVDKEKYDKETQDLLGSL